MSARLGIAILVACGVSACATGKLQIASDLNVALDVAAAANGAYAAQPNANAKTVADLARLLAVAQAAVASWEASAKPQDKAIADAAVSALVAYETSAGITP